MGFEPVRIALIGAGRMGQIHLAAVQRAEGAELAGVAEPYAPVRNRLREAGIEVFETVEQLTQHARPDGVLVAAPSERHPAIVELLALARLPILCEKPVGLGAEAARGVAETVERTGILLQVGYWRRFVPELRALRDRVAAGELGEICHLACMQWDHGLPTEAFRATSGGIAVDMGVHEFDQARWLLGQEFEWVAATAAGPSTVPRPPTDPDSATILGRMSAGASVTISLGRQFPGKDSCWLEIWGTTGHERLPFMWERAGEMVFRDSMVRQVETFARAIRGGPAEAAGVQDAIAALVVAEWSAEALRSSATAQQPAAASVP